MNHLEHLSYIIGVALGDGNLSSPNGRATRLRVTCDSKYPKLTNEIIKSLEYLFPKNKVSISPGPKSSYYNISVYSNNLNDYMPWQVNNGSKFMQNARVPNWIKCDKNYSRHCLRGLIQTDGSIYEDRGYKMINFTNVTKNLSEDVFSMTESLGYRPHIYKIKQRTNNFKYTVRFSKDVSDFIKEINLVKS